ncbi:MAG TPA: family 20 glycosylhydrolase [Candidatus Elarobacter sp.]
MRRFLVSASVLLAGAAVAITMSGAAGAAQTGPPVAVPALVPQPATVRALRCPAPLSLARSLRFPPGIDPAGFELVRSRWTALGIPAPLIATPANVVVRLQQTIVDPPEFGSYSTASYRLRVGTSVQILGKSEGGWYGSFDESEGEFDALTTLAQLPVRRGGRWVLPCADIEDEPVMRWRIVSDDISRGPFPTMDYAKRRIRALASLKINGWSPYMEQTFFDPAHPYAAWPSGFTAAQLRELTAYARRFHVMLIPEQQTFAHMHESLKWETLAPLAELPHGYLLAESDPATYRYLEPLVKGVAEAAKRTPFVHLGADEPLDLGRGRTPRTPHVFADHVTRVASFLAGTRARPMIWDDAVQQDPSILPLLPRDVVIVTFHYGVEKTYKPYIDAVAGAGFQQMVSPSAANFNEIYPDLGTSYANLARFVGEGKGARGMLGMFMTVWHDDGESLFEATWPAVAYAAASAWQRDPVDDKTWHRTFARAFFGSDDAGYASDLDNLQAMRSLIRTTPSDPPDYLFWHDPFDPALQARAASIDTAALRRRAETALRHLWNARPPLHAGAVAAMKLGALRYDALGRRLQIGKEARDYYDDARAHATAPGVSQVYRSLNVAKYLCWELRNGVADLEPLYAAAWRNESTEPGLERMRAHYRVAADDAQRCADRIDRVTREDYLRKGTVPAWDEVMSSAR